MPTQVAHPARLTPTLSPLPCPCGRAHPLAECCLPVAQQLRRSAGGASTPFDEIRATSALLLWGMLARERDSTSVVDGLSRAARQFWGGVLAATYGSGVPTGSNRGRSRRETPRTRPAWPRSAPAAGKEGARPASRPDEPGRSIAADGAGPDDPTGEFEYGCRLFERTWGTVDPSSRTWLHASLPTFVCADILLGELALDWLLWDRPWMRGMPAAHWTARSAAMSGHLRVQRTTDAILRSRLGLWRLDEAAPRRGFQLTDRLTGDRTWLDTASAPWPDAGERLMLGRIYAFNDWRLLGGRCLLLDPLAVDDLLTALHRRRAALHAPPPHDPRWRPWLKAELAPLVAAQWFSSRLAPLPPDRYDGAYC